VLKLIRFLEIIVKSALWDTFHPPGREVFCLSIGRNCGAVSINAAMNNPLPVLLIGTRSLKTGDIFHLVIKIKQ